MAETSHSHIIMMKCLRFLNRSSERTSKDIKRYATPPPPSTQLHLACSSSLWSNIGAQVCPSRLFSRHCVLLATYSWCCPPPAVPVMTGHGLGPAAGQLTVVVAVAQEPYYPQAGRSHTGVFPLGCHRRIMNLF